MLPGNSGRAHNRPRLCDSTALADLAGGVDPSERAAAAHATAWLVAHGPDDAPDGLTAEQHQRLLSLMDAEGVELLTQLWADSPPDSLPGALWRLYVVATWVKTNPVQASQEYSQGRDVAPVMNVIAGVADPPGPDAVLALVDSVMTGVGGGDMGITLHRVSAFVRIVAAGRISVLAESEATVDPLEVAEAVLAGARPEVCGSDQAAVHSVGALLDMATHLHSAAVKWGSGALI